MDQGYLGDEHDGDDWRPWDRDLNDQCPRGCGATGLHVCEAPVRGITDTRYERLIDYLERLLKEAQAERQLIVTKIIDLHASAPPTKADVMRALAPTRQEIKALVAEWDESEAIKEAHKRGDHGHRDH